MMGKWYLGILLLWFAIGVLVLVTEGATLGPGETSHINELLGENRTNLWGYFDLLWTVFVWKFDFFESGIGTWLKVPLLALSISIVIPLAIEIFRALKPFGG